MSVLPDLERALIDAARRAQAPDALRSRRVRRTRVVAIALAATLGLAGIALAATRIIAIGRPVPPLTTPRGHSVLGQIVPGTAKLLAVRAADPDGGPPWGLRVFRTIGSRRVPQGDACVQAGRIVNGKLGVLGQDGAFHNDGRFHELPVEAEGCGGLDAKGQLFLEGGATAQTASGYTRTDACETPVDRAARLAGTRSLREALRLQVQRGERSAVRIQRRVIARFERRAREHHPLCPKADLRDVVFGLVGSEATHVTLDEPGVLHLSQRLVAADSGAYLFALRGMFRDHQRLQRRYYYPHGVVCGRGLGVQPTASCSSPPGFVAPTPPQRLPTPPAPRPALHLPITVLRGLAIRFTPPATGRYDVMLQCSKRLPPLEDRSFYPNFDNGPTRVLRAGHPATVRLHPIPTFCGRRVRGDVRSLPSGQVIGQFTIALHP